MEDVRVVARGARTPDLPLVDGVSLKLGTGEMVGVVGETGAGKSLTMLAILGLLPPGISATGSICVGGAVIALDDVRRLRELLGRATSVVLQNPIGMLDP